MLREICSPVRSFSVRIRSAKSARRRSQTLGSRQIASRNAFEGIRATTVSVIATICAGPGPPAIAVSSPKYSPSSMSPTSKRSWMAYVRFQRRRCSWVRIGAGVSAKVPDILLRPLALVACKLKFRRYNHIRYSVRPASSRSRHPKLSKCASRSSSANAEL
jgi:hypothetical protein